jgi:hypothetical protein
LLLFFQIKCQNSSFVTIYLYLSDWNYFHMRLIFTYRLIWQCLMERSCVRYI